MPYFEHNGHRLFYRASGDGPLLLLLPGNTASSVCHEGELAHFGQRYHAVALDFWGTGQSDRLAQWPVDWWSKPDIFRRVADGFRTALASARMSKK